MPQKSVLEKVTLSLASTIRKNPFWKIISGMFVLLTLNCLLASYQVNTQINNEFDKHFSILSSESKNLIANNYTIVEALAYNLSQTSTQTEFIKNFEHDALTIGKYTANTLLLADSSHNIISIIPKAQTNLKQHSVKNREYIRMVLEEPDEIHVGHIVQGITTKIWAIPIAKGIFVGKKHLGTVILSIPLTEFSNSLTKSKLILKDIAFGTKNDLSFYFHENDRSVLVSIKPNNLNALLDVLSNMINPKHDMAKTSTYEPISGVFENITLVMPALHARLLFLRTFAINLLNFVSILTLLGLIIFLVKYPILRKLDLIENKMLDTVLRLKPFIPEYRALHFGLSDSKTLQNIENLANRASYGVATVENLMRQKNQQIQVLQRHFIACISASKEKATLLVEKINDTLEAFSTIKTLLKRDHQQFLDMFEKIYYSSKSYDEYTQSIEDITSRALQIISLPKQVVSIKEILDTDFSSKFESLVVNNKPYDSTDDVTTTNTHKMFYKEALKECITAVLSIADGSKIVLSSTNLNTTIEITFALDDNQVGTHNICHLIKKARFFALLDEGLISLFRSNNMLIVTIMYGTLSDMEAISNKL